MRKLMLLLVLVILAVFMLSCEKDNDNNPNTDYDFLSFTDFNEWYQDHTWAFKIAVIFSSEESNFMIIEPYLRSYRDNIASEDDDFFLSVNGTSIPLMYHLGNVFVSDIGPDIYLDYDTVFHVIFKINGVDKINKKVNIPSEITVNSPENLDFTNPVTFTWSSATTPDYQSTYCYVKYHHNPNPAIYHSSGFQKMVSKHSRQYTLPASEYLSYFQHEYGVVENPLNLELYIAAITAINFEEQNNNVISAEVYGNKIINK